MVQLPASISIGSQYWNDSIVDPEDIPFEGDGDNWFINVHRVHKNEIPEVQIFYDFCNRDGRLFLFINGGLLNENLLTDNRRLKGLRNNPY